MSSQHMTGDGKLAIAQQKLVSIAPAEAACCIFLLQLLDGKLQAAEHASVTTGAGMHHG